MIKTLRSFFVMISLLFLSTSASAAVVAGDKAPDFTLTDADGVGHALSDFQGKFVVLEWINHDCPFVKKHYNSGNMQALQEAYAAKDVVWLSIASSGPGLQGHYEGEDWKELTAEKKAQPSAVLLDPQGTVGRLYGAQTTPHMFVVNPEGVVIYSGAIDSTPTPHAEDIADSENYVAQALDQAMAGEKVSTPSTKAYGCPVKYAS